MYGARGIVLVPEDIPGPPVKDHGDQVGNDPLDRKSTRLNSSHQIISYAVFCLKKKKNSPPTHPKKTKKLFFYSKKAASEISTPGDVTARIIAARTHHKCHG